MNKFVISSIIALGIAANAGAQTYLDHLKKNVAGEGNVTVTESKEIDELVNGKKIQTQQKAGNTVIKGKKTETNRNETNHNKTNIKPQSIIGDSRSEERRVGKECRSRWSP